MKEERLTLATLCGGALQEKVDRALQKVADNILDPNTDADKKRVITLKLTFKPKADDREDVAVATEVQVALASETGTATQVFVTKDLANGHISVLEHRKGEIRGQIDFDDLGMAIENAEPSREAEDTEAGSLIDLRKQKHIG